jgi:hypothetical protein
MTTPSGAQWCAQFPGSKSLDDLAPPFGASVKAFIAALTDAGARVTVSATYRPPERAYLMHWCCRIAGYHDKTGFHIDPPSAATPMAGVDIDWMHRGDTAAAKSAAAAMVKGYDIAFPAVLVSRHTEKRAIDMTITWTGTLNAKDASGTVHAIPATATNAQNPGLIALGKSYKVIKLATDPPHWSDDGH